MLSEIGAAAGGGVDNVRVQQFFCAKKNT